MKHRSGNNHRKAAALEARLRLRWGAGGQLVTANYRKEARMHFYELLSYARPFVAKVWLVGSVDSAK